jgi:hypothetical protein
VVKILSSLILLIFLIMSTKSFALPIDWHGFFGVDTNSFSDYRGLENTDDGSGTAGSTEVPLAFGDDKAKWQSYLFRLNPNMVVNDSASIKAEFSSGYGRGGRLGDSSKNNFENQKHTAALYNHNTSEDNLTINKIYMELYADTATYKIGRFSQDWALGAIYDSGSDAWDRHFFSRDGVSAEFKIGNFAINPYWAKPSSILYDNPEKDMAFGLLYASKKHKPNGSYTSEESGSSLNIGSAKVKLTDLYFRKSFGNFEFKAEIPILGGDLGNIYTATGNAKYKAKAFIFDANYKFSDAWKAGTRFGQVDGHNGSTASYEALYLNPNYQIANLMFRHDYRAIANSSFNVYDAYITNAKFIRLDGTYLTEKWVLNAAYIWAQANETARAGQSAYDHLNQKIYTTAAGLTQENDLGMEIDFNADYNWNEEITVGGSLSYWMVGDYFKFSNSAARELKTKNIFGLQARASVEF